MQIASFILVNDRLLRQFEDQLDALMAQVPSPNLAFANLVPMRLQELGKEHPISLPVSSLFPLDQAAGRQHARLLSAFEDPHRPSTLGRLAQSANVSMYYISPGRVHDFVRELEALRLAHQVHPEDVETLLGRRIAQQEMPEVVALIEQFRHDLYQVYVDAAQEGKGVVVFVTNQATEISDEDGFPRAA